MNPAYPIADTQVAAADWPAAQEAARLLMLMGWSVRSVQRDSPALSTDSVQVLSTRSSTGEDWAASGAMALTGCADGPCLYPVGRPATVARGASLAYQLVSGVVVDGPALLGERAALMGLRRRGQVSAGEGTRLLRAADGWWALNLARDADLVPALTSRLARADMWSSVQDWAKRVAVRQIIERTCLLGLAAGGLGETAMPYSPWRIAHRTAQVRGRARPRVVNLGALWAGPLLANLLQLAGAEIVDLEARSRSDPVRRDSPELYRLLHSGHEQRSIDFSPPGKLRALLAEADIVIEASRPRALCALQADADSVLADGRARTWIRITGHRDTSRVAFGDDAAVAGGLVARDGGVPVFAGDAIADPLTGLLGALAVMGTHSVRRTALIDIAMAEVAAYCAAHSPPPDEHEVQIANPRVAYRARRPSS